MGGGGTTVKVGNLSNIKSIIKEESKVNWPHKSRKGMWGSAVFPRSWRGKSKAIGGGCLIRDKVLKERKLSQKKTKAEVPDECAKVKAPLWLS